jgi:hypothetical protein
MKVAVEEGRSREELLCSRNAGLPIGLSSLLASFSSLSPSLIFGDAYLDGFPLSSPTPAERSPSLSLSLSLSLFPNSHCSLDDASFSSSRLVTRERQREGLFCSVMPPRPTPSLPRVLRRLKLCFFFFFRARGGSQISQHPSLTTSSSGDLTRLSSEGAMEWRKEERFDEGKVCSKTERRAFCHEWLWHTDSFWF